MRARTTRRAVGVGSAMALAALTFGAVPAEAQQRCEIREERDLDLGAADLDRIRIEAHSGRLVVQGREGETGIRVHAVLCASDRERMEAMDVTLERSGAEGRLRTIHPDWNGGGWGRDRYARIDLQVDVPAGMAAEVEDGSGEAEIRGVGELVVRDGSGALRIEDVSGRLRVDDGSGELHIRGVEGDVEVEDGSGGVEIRAVSGSVRLRDGSGAADIAGVGRDVVVEDKGSGRVQVDDVRGDLRVDGTRRERIHYSNVGGAVDLPPARRRGRRGG